MKRSTLIVLTLSAITIALLFFFRSNDNQKKPYETTQLSRKNLTQTVNATGTLQPQDQITVGSLVAGRVIQLHADDNDVVKKGDLLLVLDDGIDDQSIKIAHADLETARAEFIYQEAFYTRQKELFESGQLAADLFEQETRNFITSRERVNSASAKLSLEKRLYDNKWVHSPDDGIIISRRVDLGQMITSVLQATELFMIAKDLHYMEAHIDVDEADIGLIKVGQHVTFTVDAFPLREYIATVKQINYLPRIKESVVTYKVILNVANPDLSLRPGMTTNVDIIVAHAEQGLTIPNKALRINTESLKLAAQELGYDVKEDERALTALSSDFIWVLEKKIFKQIKITPGVITRRFTECKDGLDENATIVTFIQEPNAASKLLQRSFGGGGIGKK